MRIDQVISNIYQLPEASLTILEKGVAPVNFEKGHILLQPDRVEKNIYFIKSGIVRAYADTAKGQVTFWFGVEGDAVLSMRSYVSGERSYESIELLEDCELYELNIAYIKQQYEQDVHLANWGRKLAEHELIRTEERLIAMQFKTAQQRYADLMDRQPQLLQRVPLGHIASYLGMSQVSLSRIRAGQQ